MKNYNLLSGGLNPIDYVLIASLIAVMVMIVAVVIWRKAKGKNSCGCDCGGCPSSSACNGKCSSCNSCSAKKEDKNATEKHPPCFLSIFQKMYQ